MARPEGIVESTRVDTCKLVGTLFGLPIRVLVRGESEGMNPSIDRIPGPWEQEWTPGFGRPGCERVVTCVYRLITGPERPS